MPLSKQAIAILLAEKQKNGQISPKQNMSLPKAEISPYKSEASPELPQSVSMPKQHLPAIKPLKLKKFSKLSSIIKPIGAIKPPKI